MVHNRSTMWTDASGYRPSGGDLSAPRPLRAVSLYAVRLAVLTMVASAAAIAGCGGTTAKDNVQARHVYPHTARGRIEAALANGRHVDRVSCVERRARHYVCRLIFSDQPDNTATVDVLRNGGLLVGEDTGTTAYPQTKTLSQP
jgi:hypothetical protein